MVTLTVTGSNGLSSSQQTSLIVGDPPPPLAITSTSPLTTGLMGTSYSEQLQAENGSGPYAWAQSSGPLPPGLVLSMNEPGVISGTPQQVGTWPLTVTVTDSEGAAATAELEITIHDPEDLTATFIRIVIGSEKSELIGDTYNFGFNLRFLMLGQWASLVQQVECPREDQIRFLEIGVLLARRADRGDHDAFWALHLISDKLFPQLNTPWGSEGFLGNWKRSAMYDRIDQFEQFREMPPLSSKRPLGPVLNSQRITPMTVLRAGDIRIDLNNLRHKRVTGSAKQAASRKP